ncbi:carboxymuconolactone decarboxylase family protein [Actinomadura parmotrematis]|uniref:Carboxymuconolactone decarboxylase family protein n=1 Tax=Actinomadura parmotrematis TaxID=2864039 RepID=A0ABS7FKL5_9ACTN|nr:carboxymuconolactone decarboxylase family protein [Actinomadura parmotrematis]MBW8480902.1 carboxymuconolactone decarboxylase family protein [Actinomadura parmotrematis]
MADEELPVPRVPPLPEDRWDDVLKAVVASTGPLNVFTTLARHPDLFASWIGLGSRLLMRGTLDARVREIAILRTAHHRSCEYEWLHHRRLGLEAGLAEAEIGALRLDAAAHGWAPADRAVVDAADELHATGTLSDGAWRALAGRFDERGLIELVMLVGHYHMVAFALNALRVQPEEEE